MIKIKRINNKTSTVVDLADFNRKAALIFETKVRPQIAKAKECEKPANTVTCDNPI